MAKHDHVISLDTYGGRSLVLIQLLENWYAHF